MTPPIPRDMEEYRVMAVERIFGLTVTLIKWMAAAKKTPKVKAT